MKTEPTKSFEIIEECCYANICECSTDKENVSIAVDVNDVFEIAKVAFQEGQSNPKIKQLEWSSHGLYYNVKTEVGHYMILQGDEQYLENHNTCTLTHNGNLMAEFDSIDEAKSAAQEHFEQKVKECLE